MAEGLTSWPGRWTLLRISWQTHPRSPEQSPQNTPSRHRPLWHPGSLRHRHSDPQWCTGTDAERNEENFKYMYIS